MAVTEIMLDMMSILLKCLRKPPGAVRVNRTNNVTYTGNKYILDRKRYRMILTRQ
jgi:hypothetical protein